MSMVELMNINTDSAESNVKLVGNIELHGQLYIHIIRIIHTTSEIILVI